MSADTRADHNKFCLTEKWEVVRNASGDAVVNARGDAVGHHITYELDLDDGRRLRTRVSRPANKTTYGPQLWTPILREQLEVTEAEFWACVRHKQLPARSRQTPDDVMGALPAGLVYQLIHVAHLSEDEVMALSLEEANARMAAHWSQPPG